ncbi:ABC transporter substrate-binding protein [Haloplanus litoreus]|uniref:ABC transporter substrate-binding protein n=1 Tax=Haloplanus litoreus TaxID=767515 RepID=UPI003623A6EE
MNTIRAVLVACVVVATLGSPGVGAATAAEDCTFPITRTDATGTDVTLSADPDEVVTLNPSAAQTMYEIDAWDDVVGVSSFADYLPGADEKTTVGSGNTDATVERTIALDPDLVLAPNTIDDSVVSQLRAAGLTVYKFEAAETLDDIVEKTRLTGELVGACEGADSRADEMERQLDVIEGAVDGVDRPKVFYTFFGFTAGDGTFVHEVIETAGGDNIAADTADINASGGDTSGYFVASSEIVVAADPAWFVLSSDEYDRATVPSGAGGVYEETTAYREERGRPRRQRHQPTGPAHRRRDSRPRTGPSSRGLRDGDRGPRRTRFARQRPRDDDRTSRRRERRPPSVERRPLGSGAFRPARAGERDGRRAPGQRHALDGEPHVRTPTGVRRQPHGAERDSRPRIATPLRQRHLHRRYRSPDAPPGREP